MFSPSEITTNWPGEKPSENVFDRSVLPSAPRASQALQIDHRRLPKNPPYTVYLGNLSYECSEEDIKRFFDRKKLSVRKGMRLRHMYCTLWFNGQQGKHTIVA